VEAVIHGVARPGPLKSHYLKLKAKKGNKIARVACARKLATYIYHMLKENKDFTEVTAYLKSDLG
jgi:heat shock protein HspQ